jgi:hypothetical protein
MLWALLFWAVFFVGIAWHVLQIPMGLGGAVYPAIYLFPVLLGSMVYQLIILLVRRGRSLSDRQLLFWSVYLPCCAIAVCLVVFCPMDADQSFLGYLWSHAW